MSDAFFPVRRRAAALLLAALWPWGATATADVRATTRFEVFGFAGLSVLTLHTLTEESGGRYNVTVDYATKGMAKVFVDLTTHSQASGRLVTASAQPEMFRSETRRNGAQHDARVTYSSDGTPSASTNPPVATAVSAGQLRGTVDNLTAYFRLERQLAQNGKCGLTVRVFDGRHGYDLTFSDVGKGPLQPASGQNFNGDAIACAMVRRNWPSEASDPERDEGARSGTLWYARLLPGDLMVPVRMKLDTQLGVVDGYLAELHGEGVNLTLMK